jgi:hypothetical protein
VLLLGISKICFTTRNAKPLDNFSIEYTIDGQVWCSFWVSQKFASPLAMQKPLDNLKTRPTMITTYDMPGLVVMATTIRLLATALNENPPPFACVHITLQVTMHIWIN